MIADTSFIIDLMRNVENAVSKADELDKKGEVVFATSVSFFELWQGAQARDKEKLKDMEKKLEAFGLISMDVESAKKGGEIHFDLISSGKRIDPEDSMIAGVALQHSHTLLTRDERFSRINGLKTESY